jgi:hypothetical protein
MCASRDISVEGVVEVEVEVEVEVQVEVEVLVRAVPPEGPRAVEEGSARSPV